MPIDFNSLARYLPTQGPIRNFVHHNTLGEFQKGGYHFHDAIRVASDLYGTKEYFAASEYIKLYRKGEITDFALDKILEREGGDKDALRTALFRNNSDVSIKREGLKERGFFTRLAEKRGIHVDEIIHPVIVRMMANYLDQGVLSLNFSQDAKTFWENLTAQLSTADLAGVLPKSRHLILENTAEALFEKLLVQIIPREEYREVFLLEVLLALPGWAGLIHQLEKKSQAVFFERPVSLKEYATLYLALLVAHLGEDTSLVPPEDFIIPKVFAQEAPSESSAEYLLRLWHEAWELSHYSGIMAAMRDKSHSQKIRSSRAKDAKLQAFFCIDDRECSLRRLLEEFSPHIETFGVAGYYGIDAYYLGPKVTKATKQCPGPLEARYIIRGKLKRRKKGQSLQKREMNFWHRYANHLYSGWLLSHIFSFVALWRLLVSVFWPRGNFGTASAMMNNEGDAILLYEKKETGTQSIPTEGYTVKEMAERVEAVLTEIGLTEFFAPIVVVTGHGSSSTNNPYFAAYNCGACSGHSGAVNARLFALMANRLDVRTLLAKRKIKIPQDTYFIGALHDTARDEVEFFDKENLPQNTLEGLREVEALFKKALEQNARERSRRFAMLPLGIAPQNAHKEVKQRTDMLFEPRHEYNHANNSFLVIARRLVTENLFADRRLFLNSYNPFQDKDGRILEKILSAALPICAGINLEYLFSRLDSEIYGAGSKLPQNIISLLGVAIGSEGDLRTGLPTQMTEIHDPLRMMVVVEQKEALVTKILEKNRAIKSWVELEWVFLSLYDAQKNTFKIFHKGKFIPFDLPSTEIPVFTSSEQITKGTRENIFPARIHRRQSLKNSSQKALT